MADLEEQNLIYGLHTSNAQLKSNPKAISKIYIKCIHITASLVLKT